MTQLKPSQTVLAVGSATSAVYYLYMLFSHVSMLMLDNRAQLCSDAEWAWSLYSDCFRSGFLWPALLLFASSFLASVLAACFILPSSVSATDSSGFACNGSAPLARLSVGSMKTPVCRPLGSVVAVDNRLQIGTIITILLAVQTVLLSVWHYSTNPTSDSNTLLYPKELARSSLPLFVLALASLIAYAHSNRLFYVGLFPWVLPALVSVQLTTGLIEIYFSFFTVENSNIPIFGCNASVYSNFLISTTTLSLVIAILFLFVQRRIIFTRLLHNTDNADLDFSYIQLADDAETIVDIETTPLGHPNEKKVNELVDMPEFNSSWFDRLSFSWLNDLLCKGAARQLQYSDLYKLDITDMPVANWRRYLHHRKPDRSLLVTIALAFGPEFLLQILFSIIVCILNFAGPFFLQRILRSIDMSNRSSLHINTRSLYLDAFGLLFFNLLASLIVNQLFWNARRVGICLNGLLVAELTSKTLRRRGKGSLEEKSKTKDAKKDDPKASSAADGKIMNLLTTDFQRVVEVTAYLTSIYSQPLTLIIGIWYMYQLIGVSALVGLSLACVYVPLSKMLVNRLAALEEELNAISDERVSMITEVLQGIKAVKLFGWESRFVSIIAAQREYHLKYLWKMAMWQFRIGIATSLGPMLILLVIFTTYVVVLDNKLTAEVAFASISVFQLVRIVFERMPEYLNWAINGYVSLCRIDSYLGQPQAQDLEKRVALEFSDALGFECADLEWESPEGAKDNSPWPDTQDSVIASKVVTKVGTPEGELSNSVSQPTEETPLLARSSHLHVMLSTNASTTSLSHQDDLTAFSLKNIDIQFPIDGLSIVAGPTGSGKSSLLSALIGEMTLTRGRILLPTVNASMVAASDGKYRDVIELSNEGLAINAIAYVAQEAWLRNATIRENILFGEPYNKDRYEEVLRACALKPDLRILNAGDMTEIGERGVTLSGGQKQRVALARAVYSSRRILLIDDCLSAVDAHTGKHILMECLLNKTSLMQGRTRVLVTHHVAMCMPFAQFLVVMDKGKVSLKGTPVELQMQGDLTKALAEVEGNQDKDTISKKKPKAKAVKEGRKGKPIEDILDGSCSEDVSKDSQTTKKALAKAVNDTKPESEYNIERLQKIAQQKGLDPNSDLSAFQGILVADEHREEGFVKFKVWKTYMSACGSKAFLISSILLLVLWQAVVIAQSYWIRIWVNSNSSNTNASIAGSTSIDTPSLPTPFHSTGPIYGSAMYLTSVSGSYINSTVAAAADSVENMSLYIVSDPVNDQQHSPIYWLGIYVLIGLVAIFGRAIQNIFIFQAAIDASRTLHTCLLQAVFRATPRFFNLTPVGRIISRFSRDMHTIDEVIINNLMSWISGMIAVLGVYAVTLSVTPMFIFIALAILIVYMAIAHYYLNTSRELKRLESNSMSPLLSLFSELIQGVSTIRAFGAKHYYIKEALNRISAHNRTSFLTLASNRWFAVRIDCAGAAVSFSCALFILFNLDWMDASLAGFVLSYALTFSERMFWVVRNYSTNEFNMNAVERVRQYTLIEQEAALESKPEHKPSALWPKSGDIQIENLVAEYMPGVPVLHGISLSVKHGEKVGVVGRTGAGKSTLSLALLRFVEASGGRIVLDGVDISKIGLEDLRRNVTIIPQDPVLFNGTIRFNLDPFNEYPDEIVWDALRRTHLVRENSSHSPRAATSINASEAGIGDAEALAVERMSGIFNSLGAEIKENGQNLSLGQRQLVALARALVRRSRLIIMDEATASVDFDTDDRIQRTIRGYEFANSTLLCIAHRLRTIIDYDRVLVLDKGKVAEFDTPYNLLQNRDGIFRSMCEKSGEYGFLAVAADRKSNNKPI